MTKDIKICYCKSIYESEIRVAISKGAKNLQDIKDMTSACTGDECRTMNPKGTCCQDEIMEILRDPQNVKL